MLDTLAGLLIGAFLLTVAVRGNSGKLVDLAKRDHAFLQWAIAVGVLYYLYNVPQLHDVMGWLIVLAFLGLFLTSGPKIAEQATNFWHSLGA